MSLRKKIIKIKKTKLKPYLQVETQKGTYLFRNKTYET